MQAREDDEPGIERYRRGTVSCRSRNIADRSAAAGRSVFATMPARLVGGFHAGTPRSSKVALPPIGTACTSRTVSWLAHPAGCRHLLTAFFSCNGCAHRLGDSAGLARNAYSGGSAADSHRVPLFRDSSGRYVQQSGGLVNGMGISAFPHN